MTAEADDAEAARRRIEEQVPEGYELLQVHNSMPRGGRVIATGQMRPEATRELSESGITAVDGGIPAWVVPETSLDGIVPEFVGLED